MHFLTNKKPETLHHFLFHCPHSNLFWKDCEQYAFSITKQNKVLNFQDIIIGSIDSLSCPLLNYLILIGKLYLWDCRREHLLPCIEGFKSKLKIKYQTEKYIYTKNNNLSTFYNKWKKNFPFKVSLVLCCVVKVTI